MNCSFSKEALVMMPVEPVMFSGSMYQGISAIFNEPTRNGSVESGFLMSLSLSLHQSCPSMWLWVFHTFHVEVSRLRFLRSWRLQVQPFPAKFYSMSVRDCIWKKVWIHVDSTMFLVPGLHSFITNGCFHRNSLVLLAGSSAHLLNGRRPFLWPASNFIKNAGSFGDFIAPSAPSCRPRHQLWCHVVTLGGKPRLSRITSCRVALVCSDCDIQRGQLPWSFNNHNHKRKWRICWNTHTLQPFTELTNYSTTQQHWLPHLFFFPSSVSSSPG